jgi:pimeloyl-ACP methyl ester carboxylesterase
VLAQLNAPEPLLVGHSDGGSIALIHAGHHPVAGIALLAPQVIVEDITVAAIREARRAFDSGALRERMARHHADPDAAFNGWCDVPEPARLTRIPGAQRTASARVAPTSADFPAT